MKKDLISVIVPCFNVERFLDDCFASLENQTYKSFEVIFVNDGSTDGTIKKLQTFCQLHPNTKLIEQKNQGVSAARNAGVAASQGQFVCFFDPDDILSPFYLEKLYQNYILHNCDVTVCALKRISENCTYKKAKQQAKKAKK